jgi:hypothetical protein
MRQVYAIAISSSPEIEEQNPAASGDESVGDAAEGKTRGADAVN